MLLPDQVIPFLAHADELLRDRAILYFTQAHDVAPLTADAVWQAIDALDDSVGFAGHVALLPLVPASDASTARLLAALGDDADQADRLLDAEETLWDALYDLDFDQLRRHQEAILARAEVPDESGLDLREDVRTHLRARLALADAALDDLWNELVRLADETKDQYWDQLDRTRFDRLVEALARHGQAAADRAMAFIEDAANHEDPREVFVIQLLARLRHRPALDPLVARFLTAGEDDDVLHENLMYAIPPIGGADAAAAIEAAFPDNDIAFRDYSGATLGRIKHPAAEAVLLRLLERPLPTSVREGLAMGLADLIPTDGLPALKEIVLKRQYDPKFVELDQYLVEAALMTGADFPELGLMREEVVARQVERDRRFEQGDFGVGGLGYPGDADALADMQETIALLDQLGAALPEPPENLHYCYAPVTAPIKHTEPKVGRNDPCPCGSGKKYKKCCLGK
jgi:hypothetical protein